MYSINKMTILGNLGKDPIVKTGASGKKFASFSVATSERIKDKEGNKKDITEWHNVVVFSEPLVNYIEEKIKKGTKVYIEAPVRTRTWDNDRGEKQYTREMVVSGFDSKFIVLSGDKDTNTYDGENHYTDKKIEKNELEIDLDDEIPF